MLMGSIGALSKGEIALCAESGFNARTLWRAWDYWTGRLAKAGATASAAARPVAGKAARKVARAKPAKASRARTAASRTAKKKSRRR
jgi:hypothetical protein